MPKTVPVIVTAPDGTELWFTSGTAAAEYMGVRKERITQLCVMGRTNHGYHVRYESKNKMGQLMEVRDEHELRRDL